MHDWQTGQARGRLPEIPAGAVVRMTMKLPVGAVGWPLLIRSRSHRRPTVNRRTTSRLAASFAVVVWCGSPFTILAEGPTPAPFVVAEDEAAVSGPLLLEGPIPDGPVPAQTLPAPMSVPGMIISDVPVAAGPAELVEVSPRGADAMRIDDFALDEMPFEASSGRWFWSGGWYAGVESMWMDRSRNNNETVVQDVDVIAPGRKTINYTAYGQPFDLAPGARITLGRSLGPDDVGRDRALEFIYYGGMQWAANDGWNAEKDGVLVTPLNYTAPGFNGGDRYTTSLKSDFNSWEFNYKIRRRLGRDQMIMSPGGEWSRHAERGFLPGLIVGLRLAHINEFWNMQSSQLNPPPTPPAEFGGTYDITATNWLLGMNFGSELISQNEFFYWGLRGRVAPAINFASTHQQGTGINTDPTIETRGVTDTMESGSQTGAGFLGDLTILLGWNITPNFSLQAGYDFLWVGGMATATRQFSLNNRQFEDIDAGGQTFYQGLSFGFYGSW